ncbi:MAG: TonB-dependent receptor [Alphaproteobacteria bacterium]|nr:TonB-dependent receptor [Alphaproteobacteria bacterium]
MAHAQADATTAAAAANPPAVQLAQAGSTTAPQTEQTTQPDHPATTTTATAQNAAPGAPITTQENGGLDEIVVTATRRETNLQRTPIALSVVDPVVIRDRHIESLLDLADGGVPSLRVTTFEARQSALTIGIRGIVPFDQNQTAREPGVGVYVDGVYLGRSQGLNNALFDVQRIEVLRGPQGTLFGRNTEGGALSIVTKAPSGEFGGRLTAGVGNYSEYNAEAHVDLPAFANLAFKFDGVLQHQGATTRNTASGQYGFNYYNRVGGRASARWTPIEGLTVDVSYDQAKDENTPNYSQLIDYNPNGKVVGTYIVDPKLVNPNLNSASSYILVAPGTTTKCSTCIAPLAPLVRVSGDRRMSTVDMGVVQQPSVDETHGTTAAIKYKLGKELELRSITAWRGVETHQWDASAGAHRSAFAPFGFFGRYSLSELFQHQFSQEFQIVGTLPQLDFVLGAYYFNEHAAERAATPNPMQWNVDGTAYTFVNQVPPNPTGAVTSGNQGWDRRYWFLQRDSYAVGKSYAGFGQFTYTPAGLEQFHLTAGGRFTHETRKGALTTINGVSTPYTLDYSNSRFDPMATLAFEAAPGINLYAKYSTGFRAGGANARSGTFRRFNPETVQAFEIGAKTDFLDHHVRLNVAAYQMNRKNTQIDFDFVDPVQFLPNGAPSPTFNLHTEETVNAPGTSKIKGVEVDLTVRPAKGLTLGASYAYTDVKVPPVANPIAGPLFGAITNVFTVFTPKNAVSGFIDFETPVPGIREANLRFHLDANYADPTYSFQAENVLTDSSFIVNGSIALADIALNANGGVKGTIRLWSRNLLNESHIYRRSNANANVIGDYANFNPPRTFGIEGTIAF